MLFKLPPNFLLSRSTAAGEVEISDAHIRPIGPGSIVSTATLASSAKVTSVAQKSLESVSISNVPIGLVKPINKNYPTVLGQKQETLYQPILPRHQPQILELRHGFLIETG